MYNAQYGYKMDNLERMIRVEEQEKMLILNIADYIIESKSSLRETANHFHIGKTTIGDYMKYKLPLISTDKTIQVSAIISSKTCTKELTDELKDRIYFEYELLMRGYTLKQIAYLLNANYPMVQRDLSSRIYRISDEMGDLAKEKLNSNKAKIIQKKK